MDRLTQLISIGEGRHGAHFNISGQYQLQAIYTADGTKVISSKHGWILGNTFVKAVKRLLQTQKCLKIVFASDKLITHCLMLLLQHSNLILTV